MTYSIARRMRHLSWIARAILRMGLAEQPGVPMALSPRRALQTIVASVFPTMIPGRPLRDRDRGIDGSERSTKSWRNGSRTTTRERDPSPRTGSALRTDTTLVSARAINLIAIDPEKHFP